MTINWTNQKTLCNFLPSPQSNMDTNNGLSHGFAGQAKFVFYLGSILPVTLTQEQLEIVVGEGLFGNRHSLIHFILEWLWTMAIIGNLTHGIKSSFSLAVRSYRPFSPPSSGIQNCPANRGIG